MRRITWERPLNFVFKANPAPPSQSSLLLQTPPPSLLQTPFLNWKQGELALSFPTIIRSAACFSKEDQVDMKLKMTWNNCKGKVIAPILKLSSQIMFGIF